MTTTVFSKRVLLVKQRRERCYYLNRGMPSERKFSREQFKTYLLGYFRRGRDFSVQYDGMNLVETERAGGSFIKVSMGAPQLRAEFVQYISANDSGLVFRYDQVREAFEAMGKCEPVLYKVLRWWIFERSAEKPADALATSMGIGERQLWRYVDTAIDELVDGAMLGPLLDSGEICQ